MQPDGPVVLVVAHADDEVIGAGAWLANLPEEARRQVKIAYTTDSAPANLWFARQAGFETREAYAAARVEERNKALRVAGISPEQCVEFGFRDQESWRSLQEITALLRPLLNRVQPAIILTHPYEGGHPDHDAAAFAVRQAVEQIAANAPRIVEFTSYHRGPTSPGAPEGLETGRFLPVEGSVEESVALTEEERRRKQEMFACYKTQARVLAWFTVNEERFRSAPRYDFTRPPHDGPLHYETLDWGITGEVWRQYAAAALQAGRRSHACR